MLLAAAALAATARMLPVWIAPTPPSDRSTSAIFRTTLNLPDSPDKALARISTNQRYRLRVNGRAVAVGDTPWADTTSAAPFLKEGENTVEVEVFCNPAPAPENAWAMMERHLPDPTPADRLIIQTFGAQHDEWLYVEVIDADGAGSGYYCLEKGRSDFVLGTSGTLAEHVIQLRQEPRLANQPSGTCNFSRIAAVRIRVDQKHTGATPTGTVAFPSVRLEGATTCDMSSAAGWRIEPGAGDTRGLSIAPAATGLVLSYDWRPTSQPKLAFDLRALMAGREIGRVVSNPSWRTEDGLTATVKAPAYPGTDMDQYTPIDIRDLQDAGSPPRDVAVSATVNAGTDRVEAGKAFRVNVSVIATRNAIAPTAVVAIEDWSRKPHGRQTAPILWKDGAGTCAFQMPGLARGLYRITIKLAGGNSASLRTPDRHVALAVLAPGARRIATVFDTLKPFSRLHHGLQGVDTFYTDSPSLLMAYRDLGVNFIQLHIEPPQTENGDLDEFLRFCKATRTRFALNNETSNFAPAALRSNGTNRFDAPHGCHRWDIEENVQRRAAATGLFEGVVYDEGEHMQLCRNNYSQLPDKVHRQPYLVETTGMTLPQAYDAYRAAAAHVAAYNKRVGVRMVVESVFPVLWHPLARARVTLCPKLLKEDIHPVVLAHALGAATEYGANLWMTPDLWHLDQMPGHSVREYAGALALAERTGVTNVYTEFATALCRPNGAQYEISPYGAALRDHIARLVKHPCTAPSYRTFRPDVAIVRFPDSDWGQASCYYWNTLYGAENLHSTPETREWLQIWHLLTDGVTDPRAVNANSNVYDRYTWRFDIPAPKTAVFDHLVGDRPLASARTIFLCGIQISDATRAAVRRRIRAGATCFAPVRYCPEDVKVAAKHLPARVRDGKGSWIVVSGFTPSEVGRFRRIIPQAR